MPYFSPLGLSPCWLFLLSSFRLFFLLHILLWFLPALSFSPAPSALLHTLSPQWDHAFPISRKLTDGTGHSPECPFLQYLVSEGEGRKAQWLLEPVGHGLAHTSVSGWVISCPKQQGGGGPRCGKQEGARVQCAVIHKL